MLKQPFSYYGGKQRLASKIVKLLPPHTVYVEPFCGGASVLFGKGVPPGNKHYYREVINDTNQLVVNFFRVLQNKVIAQELIERLEYTLYSKEEHSLAMQICKTPITDPIDSAWAFFCNISMSFSNKMGSGWSRGVYGRNFSDTFKGRRSGLSSFIDRLQSVNIESTDALTCINKWDSPQSLFYIDPPYPDADQGHYKGYTQDDFISLIKTVKSTQGAAVISCYANDAIPSDWVCHQFEARMSSANGKNRTDASTKRIEHVWVKPSATQVRPELVKPMHKNKVFLDEDADRQLSFLDALEKSGDP